MPQPVSKARTKRKKVNFMVDLIVLDGLKNVVPEGQRSDFVNHALSEALVQFGREQAVENMKKIQKKLGASVATAELIDAKNRGRE